MRSLSIFILAIATVGASGQTLDRVVASVGKSALTESDVLAEDRLEAFLGEEHPTVISGTADFERVRDRVIDQRLLAQEADLEGVRPVTPSQVMNRLTKVRKKYATDEAFQAALRMLGLNQQELIARLEEQERILRLVDQRLRPAAAVGESEIRAYYRDTFLPEAAKRGDDPPPLSEVEKQIREILEEKKVNQLLGEWLKQLRESSHVRIHEF